MEALIRLFGRRGANTPTQRIITFGVPVSALRSLPAYPNNNCETARYSSGISLLIFGLWDLIRSSVASIYFCVVGLLQALTPFSPTGRFATLLPYLGNKLIELFFVYRSNQKHLLHDYSVNTRPIRALRGDAVVRISCKDIEVGDIILLEAEIWRDEEIPVDLILLHSASDVFLSLASLTGEKDPVRRVPVAGLNLADSVAGHHRNVYGLCSSLSGQRESIDLFRAELRLGAERYPCLADNFLPAGSALINGSEVYGLVFATGSDRKIAAANDEISLRNQNILDRTLNHLTKATLCILVLLIFTGSAGYLMTSETLSLSDMGTTAIIYFLLFNGLVAQTLQFSLTLVRAKQGEDVPDDDKNSPGAFEQLCLCDAAVFDKTGTLTANLLVPKYITVPTAPPLDNDDDDEDRSSSNNNNNDSSSSTGTEDQKQGAIGIPLSLSSSSSPASSPSPSSSSSSSSSVSSLSCSSSSDVRKQGKASSSHPLCRNGIWSFYGWHSHDGPQTNLPLAKLQWPQIPVDLHNMFVAALLNHSVVPRPTRRQLEFFGTSADEVAIVETVHGYASYTFSRSNLPNGEDEITLTCPYERDCKWHVIQVFKYSSAKGKMSVVVRNVASNHVYIITKGSAGKMVPILHPNYFTEAEEQVHQLSTEGLRILVFARKRIADWDESFQPRLEELRRHVDPHSLDTLLPALETDMEFLGVTGTQDSLHHNVDEMIRRFQDADVKTVLCTGDIRGTAQNIGINAGILPNPLNEPRPFLCDIAPGSQSISEQVESAVDFVREHPECPTGVILTHHEFREICSSDQLSHSFAELVQTAKGVVIAQADPVMKLKVTQFLKDRCNYVTMSVGDGANDIPMLREADVGIGIKKGENQNAAAASDLAVGVVTDLPERVFTLSPRYWLRNSKIPKFISSMKLTVVLTIFLFDIFNGFAGKSIFNGTQLLFFNLFYGWSILTFGIAYQSDDVPRDRHALRSEISLGSYVGWLLRSLFDTLFALVLSNSFFDSSTTISFFGDNVCATSFVNWVLLILMTNLRVSIDIGMSPRNLKRNLLTHLTVFATIFVFLLVALMPRYLQLPVNFFPFLIVSISLYILGNLLFERFQAQGSIKVPTRIKEE